MIVRIVQSMCDADLRTVEPEMFEMYKGLTVEQFQRAYDFGREYGKELDGVIVV